MCDFYYLNLFGLIGCLFKKVLKVFWVVFIFIVWINIFSFMFICWWIRFVLLFKSDLVCSNENVGFFISFLYIDMILLDKFVLGIMLVSRLNW